MKDLPEKKDVNLEFFELPCYWQTPQVDSILLPQVQGELMESESPDTKKVWNNKKSRRKDILVQKSEV